MMILILQSDIDLKSGDSLVGKLDAVAFAAVKKSHNDLKEPIIGLNAAAAQGTGPAQIIRGDGIGLAYGIKIHNVQIALDQHAVLSILRIDNIGSRQKFPGRKQISPRHSKTHRRRRTGADALKAGMSR
jgi:hypothetical protein